MNVTKSLIQGSFDAFGPKRFLFTPFLRGSSATPVWFRRNSGELRFIVAYCCKKECILVSGAHSTERKGRANHNKPNFDGRLCVWCLMSSDDYTFFRSLARFWSPGLCHSDADCIAGIIGGDGLSWMRLLFNSDWFLDKKNSKTGIKWLPSW
jgi:hypothetical protein